MIQPRIFCELHEGKLPGRDGVTISGSVQERSGWGRGDVDFHGPAGLMLGLKDSEGLFQAW